MRYLRPSPRRLWITAGLAAASLASALVVVRVNEKAQRLAGWLPRVTIDRKARKITLGIHIALSYKSVVLPPKPQ